ncbi:hypothetical protein [Pseudoalteromonas piscicida]|uniref:hypothetical protein n=1 Tax=Pseudoalteromonas piscicida TaxID=43662 RepID=UPI003095E695
MNHILQTVHYQANAFLLFGIALLTAMFGSSSFWSSHQALFHWVLPLLSIVLLLRLAWHIRATCLSVSPKTLHQDVKLCWVALLLCTCGDIVNFNLFEQYYRQDPKIKHDYLIDSIWFFALGYGLLLWLLIRFLRRSFSLNSKHVLVIALVSAVLSFISYQLMYLPGISKYSLLLSALYSLLVTLLGVFGLWLLVQNIKSGIKVNYALACGFILAMLADAIIGQFWLFANGGAGYFPLARHVNWLFYIASQSLLLLFPVAMVKTLPEVKYKKGRVNVGLL